MRVSQMICLLGALSIACPAFSETRLAVDPYEPVVVAPEKVQDPAMRATVLSILEHARQNFNLHANGGPSFDLRVSFRSVGDTSRLGDGSIEELWMGPGQWRWSVEGSGYSQLRIANKGIYEQQAGSAVPLRVQTLRSALFWPVNLNPAASMRAVHTTWRGEELYCALFMSGPRGVAPGATRTPLEKEYCMDKQGSLRIYSEAPGAYVIYDESMPVSWRGHKLPQSLTIFEAGSEVMHAQIEGLTDAGTPAKDAFEVSPEMRARGAAPRLIAPMHLLYHVDSPQTGMLIVHAAADSEGNVLDAELLQKLEPRMAAEAIQEVKRHKFPPFAGDIPARQRDLYITVVLEPPGKQSGAGRQ